MQRRSTGLLPWSGGYDLNFAGLHANGGIQEGSCGGWDLERHREDHGRKSFNDLYADISEDPGQRQATETY